jgi:hypothetical protein
MRSAVTAFTVTENPVPLEPVTADPFIDALEREEAPVAGHRRSVTSVASPCSSSSRPSVSYGIITSG